MHPCSGKGLQELPGRRYANGQCARGKAEAMLLAGATAAVESQDVHVSRGLPARGPSSAPRAQMWSAAFLRGTDRRD